MTGITAVNRIDDEQPVAASGDLAEQARQVRAQYDRDLAGIAGDPGMHPVAAKIQTARAFTRASAQLRQLEQASDRARMFRTAADHGPWQSNDAMAGRDARDRAAQLVTADDAAKAINAASAAGDADLVRAVAHHAVRQAAERPESEWGDVAASYIDQAGLSDSFGRVMAKQGAANVVDKAAYWLAKPAHLRSMADYEIHSLASRDVASAVAAATAPMRSAWDSANRRSGNVAA